MNNPGFDENNRIVNKLPLPDAVEGAKPVDYHTYVLLHNELIEAQKRTEVIAGKLLVVHENQQQTEKSLQIMTDSLRKLWKSHNENFDWVVKQFNRILRLF